MQMPLLHINWNISYACPFNCEHCYSRAFVDMEEVPLEDKLVIAENIVHAKVFTVNLGGGEPLVSPDTLPVIEYLAAWDVDTSLCTNGWQATESVARQLKDAGLTAVFLSLDDIRPEVHDAFRGRHGSYEHVLRAARIYKDAGLATRLSVTMTRDNFSQLEKLIGLAQELRCDLIELKRLKLQGNAAGREDLELLPGQRAALYECVAAWKRSYSIDIVLVYEFAGMEGIDEGCPCGKKVLAIQANGDIVPCVYNARRIGNALVDDIARVWNESDTLKRLRAGGACIGLEEVYESLQSVL